MRPETRFRDVGAPRNSRAAAGPGVGGSFGDSDHDDGARARDGRSAASDPSVRENASGVSDSTRVSAGRAVARFARSRATTDRAAAAKRPAQNPTALACARNRTAFFLRARRRGARARSRTRLGGTSADFESGRTSR